jgi:hypothetical protein
MGGCPGVDSVGALPAGKPLFHKEPALLRQAAPFPPSTLARTRARGKNFAAADRAMRGDPAQEGDGMQRIALGAGKGEDCSCSWRSLPEQRSLWMAMGRSGWQRPYQNAIRTRQEGASAKTMIRTQAEEP